MVSPSLNKWFQRCFQFTFCKSVYRFLQEYFGAYKENTYLYLQCMAKKGHGYFIVHVNYFSKRCALSRNMPTNGQCCPVLGEDVSQSVL